MILKVPQVSGSPISTGSPGEHENLICFLMKISLAGFANTNKNMSTYKTQSHSHYSLPHPIKFSLNSYIVS